MSDTNTGGPAFPSGLIDPSTPEDAVYPLHRGLSIRDYFAAKAMQTLLSSEYTSQHGLHEGWMGALAHEAYMVADAMLVTRGAK
jgi:hypothetical protein